MGKVCRPIAYSVLVEPQSLGRCGFGVGCLFMSDSLIEPDEAKRVSKYHQRCKEIAEQIKRHVDNVGSVTVQAETETVCEHCGGYWTEDSDEHNGGCCNKDAAVMEAEIERLREEVETWKKTHFGTAADANERTA